jgi:hypothetical protein
MFENVLAVISAFLTALGIVVSCVSIWVAWKSMTEANRITKYEKQKRIYDVCRNLMGNIIQFDKPDKGVMAEFYKSCDEGRFLFSQEMLRYLDEIKFKAQRLLELDSLIVRAIERNDDTQAAENEKNQIYTWFFHEVGLDIPYQTLGAELPVVEKFQKEMKI